MKPKYFFAIILLIIAGCKKDATILSPGLQGTWELVSSDGAWSGHHDYPPGNGNTYTFNENNYSQIIKRIDTTYHYTGTFKIYTGKPCDFANEQTLIEFNNIAETRQSFSLSNGKLTIGTTECIIDGGYSTYRKIR
jgi:hypothetical protein